MINVEPKTYIDPRALDADAPPDELVSAINGAFAKIPARVRIVFADELARFRADLVKQLNSAFVSLSRRLEKRVEKRLGDRCESIVVAALTKAGLAPKGLL